MASTSRSSHSALASSSRSCKYDIFLSFRGKDTRKTFVDHLYWALKQHFISIYKDDETLPRGESICKSITDAIEKSRIAVIVFSKNYADSSWCMEELAYIMKCNKERGLIVIPIFYDVVPSDVRRQEGDFGKACSQQEMKNANKVHLWRNALVDASYIAGWETKYVANGHESKAIHEIVISIFDILLPLTSHVDEDLVGMRTRLHDLKAQLEIGSDDVRMVGIWGVGGGGKTTLASSLCSEISCYFEGHHIVENIREKSVDAYGLIKLQKDILTAFSNTRVDVQSIVEGKGKIKSMFCRRNVLIILDDVSELEQLDALAGSHNWFGSGSRIVITTRDEHLLLAHKADRVCPITLLSHDEAIQLFKRHAYNEKSPVEDFETVSLSMVNYAAGLPLALKVLGRFLYDKDKAEWINALAKLKDIPDSRLMNVLKISYDGLEPYEKELFLEIACFWRWRWKSDAVEIFEACGYYPEIGLKVLSQKALVTVVNGRFLMHDMVQEMGHYIVRGKHPTNPERHSRVWRAKEITKMCLTNNIMENDKIEAIDCYSYDHDHSSHLCKFVSTLKRLRYLRLIMYNDEKYIEGPTFLSNELRCIHWYGYPASRFLDNFQPINLVIIKLRYSLQKELWKGCKYLPNLKVLQLRFMKELLNTPNFDGLPSLQRLELLACYKLKEIHSSLGYHTSLASVRVSHCAMLRMFPAIVDMAKLERLEIERCRNILEFPEIQTNMESLVNLSLDLIGIELLPSSIGEHCTKLNSLYLSNLRNLHSIEFSFNALKHLKSLKLTGLIQLAKPRSPFVQQFLHNLLKLNLEGRDFKDVEIPSSIGELSNLQELNLSRNCFTRLGFSLSHLTHLKLLIMSSCEQLLELPELPSSLAILIADGCKSLTAIEDCLKNCKWLCQISLTRGSIINDGAILLQSMLEGYAIENGPMLLRLEGLDILNGFTTPLLRERICRLRLQENWCNEFCGFLMFAIFPHDFYWGTSVVLMNMKHVTSGFDSKDDVFWEESDGDKYTWVWYVSFDSLRHTIWWDEAHKALSFNIEDMDDKTKRCSGLGVRLVSKKSRSDLMETSTYFSEYTPHLSIKDDSPSALTISLRFYNPNRYFVS